MNKELNILSKQIRVGNLDIHYFTGGQGDPLVILHGGGTGGAKGWIESMTALCRHFTVYVPDLPGFGKSQSVESENIIDEFVSFVDNFTDGLELDSFYLAGHSLGAGIALRYAVKFRHKVKKLVIIDGVGTGTDFAAWIRLTAPEIICRAAGATASFFIKALKGIIQNLHAPINLPNLIPLVVVLLGTSMLLQKQEAVELVPKLALLTLPTLFIWGARDRITPVSNAWAAAEIIPDCQVHVFQDGRHSVYKQNVEEFTILMNSFLR